MRIAGSICLAGGTLVALVREREREVEEGEREREREGKREGEREREMEGEREGEREGGGRAWQGEQRMGESKVAGALLPAL
ncbi:hypothetical protein PPACK8108_LOCUS19661 [Phakopsora pachyrhizi]|uniref:Uncharacterized protein n=1 Tax=Phakopsora pachyrhizi TaxID=170000 RepID=A0AAV0BE37_PHAPC|nr:hypothetical protein PPACK8108_LOCUS19661 [Phakopsora pachyrhizi]